MTTSQFARILAHAKRGIDSHKREAQQNWNNSKKTAFDAEDYAAVMEDIVECSNLLKDFENMENMIGHVRIAVTSPISEMQYRATAQRDDFGEWKLI